MIYYVDGSKSKVGTQILITDVSGNTLSNLFFEQDLTNNDLEYLAIEVACSKAEKGSTIYSDSKLCVNQVNGEYAIKEEKFLKYVKYIRTKMSEKGIILKWIPREANLAGHTLEKKVKRGIRERKTKKHELKNGKPN